MAQADKTMSAKKTTKQTGALAVAFSDVLERISEQPFLLEIARKKIEDVLVEFRDSRVSVFGGSSTFRGNGLSIRERDGRESSIIRMGAEDAMRIGLKAIAAHLRSNTPHEPCGTRDTQQSGASTK